MLVIGLMSGTSMDGIDAALIETDGTHRLLKQISSTTIIYSSEFQILLKATEYAIRQIASKCIEIEIIDQEIILKKINLEFPKYLKSYFVDELNLKNYDKKLMSLASYIKDHGHENVTLESIISHSTNLHIQAVKQLLILAKIPSIDIEAIGYHGQTFLHRPELKLSIILGYGQVMANSLGIKVITDFRKTDIENGGQGAPFAPIYHYALSINSEKFPCVIINCGGISNVTIINSDEENDIRGFDIGPGNGLIDRLVKLRTNGAEVMDKNGNYGYLGKVNESVLELLYQKSIVAYKKDFFNSLPPKSLDIGDLILPKEISNLSLEDACATLEAFTADIIVKNLINEPKLWILAGGGWLNKFIINQLRERVADKIGLVEIVTADEIGWSSQFMEAQIFAFLAARYLKNLPFSFPSTTGVSKPVVGGKLYLPQF